MLPNSTDHFALQQTWYVGDCSELLDFTETSRIPRPDSVNSFRGTPSPADSREQTPIPELPLGIPKRNSDPTVRKIAKEKMPPRRHSHHEIPTHGKVGFRPVRHEQTTFGIMKLTRNALEEQSQLEIPNNVSIRTLKASPSELTAGFLKNEEFLKSHKSGHKGKHFISIDPNAHIYNKPLTEITAVRVTPSVFIPRRIEEIPPFIVQINEGHFGACFNPEHITRIVAQYKGRNFSSAKILNRMSLQPCDAHFFTGRLLQNKAIRTNIYRNLLANDVEQGFISSEQVNACLEDNLPDLFFINDYFKNKLNELSLISEPENLFVYRVFDFLEGLVDQRKSIQALALVSFICSHFSRSRTFCILRCEYLIRKGFYVEADLSLKIITDLEPLIAWADLIYAECLFFQNNILRASGIFPLDRDIFDNSVYARTILGIILTYQIGEVSPVLKNVLHAKPDYPLALILRADYYFSKKLFHSALQDYKKLVMKYPEFTYACDKYEECMKLIE